MLCAVSPEAILASGVGVLHICSRGGCDTHPLAALGLQLYLLPRLLESDATLEKQLAMVLGT